jgi:hypothetical protein
MPTLPPILNTSSLPSFPVSILLTILLLSSDISLLLLTLTYITYPIFRNIKISTIEYREPGLNLTIVLSLVSKA